jgi:hypothetical protein
MPKAKKEFQGGEDSPPPTTPPSTPVKEPKIESFYIMWASCGFTLLEMIN